MASASVEIKEDLCQQIPGRREHINLLLTLLGERDHYTCPSVFVYGHKSTGKTLVTDAVLDKLKLRCAKINCVETYTPKLLYELILNQAAGIVPAPENDYTAYAKCDNMNMFIRLLKQILQNEDEDQGKFCIVLDKAERLRDMDGNILPAFLRLQELTGCNVCVILISEIVWEKFRTGTGFLEPFVIHFTDYSKDDLLEIMSLDAPTEYPKEFYTSYVTLLLSVFYLACRDLSELRHLAQLNFGKYVEPIKTEEASMDEPRKLWRNIEPHLKKALQTVYLREVSSAQWEKMQQETPVPSDLGPGPSVPAPQLVTRNHVELPFYSKYLLIAAYLASYNPAKSDRRFFAKNAGKFSRQSKLVKKHERTSNQLLGPKPFPLDRLMAIFYSIVEGRVMPTANIFSQISSLVTLHLMASVGSDDQLDGPKYKCLVSLDFVRQIARTVQFDVVRYLYDFV